MLSAKTEKSTTKVIRAAEGKSRPATRSTQTELLTADDLPTSTRSRSQSMESTMADSVATPAKFCGRSNENINEWVDYFEKYVVFKQMKDIQVAALIPLLLKDSAKYWYDRQDYGTKKKAA